MKIALIGYGKMGREIEKLAVTKGHEICVRIHSQNRDEFTKENLDFCDVAIEFSNPESGFDNLAKCIKYDIPVVSGTTGWLEKKSTLDEMCTELNGAYIYASNFSIGVNIFFALNKKLAELTSTYSEYKSEITEIHHTTKLDAPSGTAITLAKGIIDNHSFYKKWINEDEDDESSLPIISKRIADAPGTHIVKYSSEVDSISISHEAKSRKGFAMGAIIAAEWIIGKKGIFSMSDVIGI